MGSSLLLFFINPPSTTIYRKGQTLRNCYILLWILLKLNLSKFVQNSELCLYLAVIDCCTNSLSDGCVSAGTLSELPRRVTSPMMLTTIWCVRDSTDCATCADWRRRSVSDCGGTVSASHSVGDSCTSGNFSCNANSTDVKEGCNHTSPRGLGSSWSKHYYKEI